MPDRPGQIITFYSYKGGTGRSMVLANVAYILATDPAFGGKQVLMVDWDLEAPGLQRYFFKDFTRRLGHTDQDRYTRALNDAEGLIDLLAQAHEVYRRRAPSGGLAESAALTPEAADVFAEVVRSTSLDRLALEVDDVPTLRMLKSGRDDEDYSDKVRRFDWDGFYRSYGSFFTHFRARLMQQYGYVLIDSRTGLTDSSGICTRVMPEKLVAVFAPNRQNIDGLKHVITRAAQHRRDSRDPRGLVAFPLASRIDGSNSTLRRTWREGGTFGEERIEGYQSTFERLFTDLYDLDECSLGEYFGVTQVPHDTDYAYGERVAARIHSAKSSDNLSIEQACANLTTRLVTLAAPWESLPDPAAEARKLADEAARAAQTANVERERLKRRLRLGAATAAAFLLMLVAGAVWLFLPSFQQPGAVRDEAMLAGRAPDTLKPAGEDYFQAVDGGVRLTPDEVRGRNAWFVWTGGNDRLWNQLAQSSGGSFDLLKVVSSHSRLRFGRDTRWQYFGLLNEPCFHKPDGPDDRRYNLWLDARDVNCPPDPFENETSYPGVAVGARGRGGRPAGSFYGFASGVVGLRLFPNPDFDEAAARKWDATRYYTDPTYYVDATLVRPYRVGVSCAFCHAGLSPVRPPDDVSKPAWENISSIVGAQQLSIDRIATLNYESNDYLFQLLHTARPGTVDLSLLATDSINNPRAVNAIYALGARLALARRWGRETLAGGAVNNKQFNDFTKGGPFSDLFRPPDTVLTPHLLADGSDSAGPLASIARFHLNIGLFSEESLLHGRMLVGGRPVSPIQIPVLRERSAYWQATETQTVNVAQFLLRASSPHRLQDAPGSAYSKTDAKTLERGQTVFADRCARCHSSKVPANPSGFDQGSCAGSGYLDCWNRYWMLTKTDGFKQEMRRIAAAPDFLADNYLSTDMRVPITLLQTNACSALATNAIAGSIWDNFSSQSYKDLPSVGTITVVDPMTGAPRAYQMPGGGRGYTRVPSLVSIWSSAPFLLNNTLGTVPSSPAVGDRLRAFDTAMEELLWPERRKRDSIVTAPMPGVIDRTTTASVLRVPGESVPDFLRPLLDWRNRYFERLLGAGSITIGPIPVGTPVNILANVSLGSEGAPAEAVQKRRALSAAIQGMQTGADASSVKDALNALLGLSTCPDFVVNRGHYFGTALDKEEPELADTDKRALIEFLKTF